MTLENELANTRLELDGARLKIARLEADIAALRKALECLLKAPMVAPEHCFNSSHQNIGGQDDCEDCAEWECDWKQLREAHDKATAVLAATAAEEKP